MSNMLEPLPPFVPPENASTTMPMASRMRPGRGDRRLCFGSAGRPDSAATTGTSATARAGCREARIAVTTARTMATPTSHHGRLVQATRWSALVPKYGA